MAGYEQARHTTAQGENGERGLRGERVDKGERGDPGATIVVWQIDRASPRMSDGTVRPMLELRELLEQYHEEAGERRSEQTRITVPIWQVFQLNAHMEKGKRRCQSR